MSALHAALRGDDALLKAIDEADRDTYAITCSTCGTYYVGNFNKLEVQAAVCPNCGGDRGTFESPAIGAGVEAAARKKEPPK